MIKLKKLISENQLAPQTYTATYRAVDGAGKTETFTGPNALMELRKFIDEWVGLNGEIGEQANYIASDDGVGIVVVKGIDIASAVGREPKPKLLPAEYIRDLANTAIKTFLPAEIVNDARFTHNKFRETTHVNCYIIDWIMPNTKDERWSEWLRIKEYTEQARLYINISQDDYTGKINGSISIFRSLKGRMDQIRDVNKYVEFKPTQNKQLDLKQLEPIFKQAEPEFQKVVKWLKATKDWIDV